MNDVKPRLVKCFHAVFPNLSEAELVSATQDSNEAWDSIAAVTLANVIEEEFSIEMDFERLAELNSFDRMLAFIQEADNLRR